jgi:hypothetical protein
LNPKAVMTLGLGSNKTYEINDKCMHSG